MTKAKEIPVIIPSLEPDDRLLSIIADVQAAGMQNIVVVNDGSSAAYAACFAKAAQMGCTVLTHSVNMGKGRALKTAFNYCLQAYPSLLGTVTADSDGQHTAASILRCAEALVQNPDKLILGCRDFNAAGVPAKNRIGNKITAFMFGALYGIKTSDTQTGLRAVPAHFMRYLLNVPGERFEYETNMLVESKEQGVAIEIVPIETIYQGESYSTHFNPVRDSWSIYKILVKFIFSSLISTLVDMVLFSAFIRLFAGGFPATYILISTVLARICSAMVNYTVNRKTVFNSSADKAASMLKYGLLCVVIVACSAGLVTLVHTWLGGSELLIKVIVDSILFCISFVVQREFVFKSKK